MALINKHWPVISKHHTPREMEFTVLLTLIKNILSKWVFFNVGGVYHPSSWLTYAGSRVLQPASLGVSITTVQDVGMLWCFSFFFFFWSLVISIRTSKPSYLTTIKLPALSCHQWPSGQKDWTPLVFFSTEP